MNRYVTVCVYYKTHSYVNIHVNMYIYLESRKYLFFLPFKKNRFFSQNAFYGFLELFLRFSPIKKKQVLKRFHKTSFDIAASWLKSNLSHPSCGHFQEARAPLPCNMFFSGSILNLIMRRISVSTIYFEVHQTFGLFRSVSYQWKLLWASTLIVMPNLLHEA